MSMALPVINDRAVGPLDLEARSAYRSAPTIVCADTSSIGDNGCVELRHLHYFLAVADTASFTQAARKLQVVQSGVSATIKALERELGATLFVRNVGGVTLTPAGMELRPHAQATIAAARAARDAVDALGGVVRGAVTVGTMTSITVVDLPAILVDLRAQHPEVSVQLRTATTGSAGLLQQLRDGDLDLAFLVFADAPPPDLDARCVAAVPLLLVVPVDHPLAARDAVSLAELAGMPFVDGPLGYGNRTLIDAAFDDAGVDRSITLEVADVGSAAEYIRSGLGIGFLSQFILDGIDDTGLSTVRITDCDLQWRLYVAAIAGRVPSAAATALLQLVGNVSVS
jgi:DNA-binding transcriptional LysR family regulator